MTAALQVREAQQMQCDVIFATILEDRRAQPFGFVEMALLERAQRLPLQARQVRHPARAVFPFRRQTGRLSGDRRSQAIRKLSLRINLLPEG